MMKVRRSERVHPGKSDDHSVSKDRPGGRVTVKNLTNPCLGE